MNYNKRIFSSFILIMFILLMISFVSAGFFDLAKGITGRASSQDTNVSIIVTGINPVSIIVVNSTLAGSTVDPSENSMKNIAFNVYVGDRDGVSDINDTSVYVNFTRSGVTSRINSSCNLVGDINTTTANFTCTIGMWYFDAPGVWNISVYANDLGNTTLVQNNSFTFSYGQLQAIVISPISLTWTSVSLGAQNQTPTNQPTLINNTGNYNVTSGNIQVKAINLHGQTITTDYISAGNFTASNNTGGSPPAECSGTALVNATDTGITNSVLGFGNHSENNNVTGQTRLFYCLNTVPTTVSSQTYSTSTAGAWVVKIA